ncbi:hypothetical protein RB195_001020 [Necator americanus]|uniref:Uncharacterized protein n=1 Tax=Necator americanus TaxID=51031 RepID=A0ABR1DCC2_NECAM
MSTCVLTFCGKMDMSFQTFSHSKYYSLRNLCFADGIVLITSRINLAGRMLTEFGEICGCMSSAGSEKTMFMRNGWVSDALFTFNGHPNARATFICVEE